MDFVINAMISLIPAGVCVEYLMKFVSQIKSKKVFAEFWMFLLNIFLCIASFIFYCWFLYSNILDN